MKEDNPAMEDDLRAEYDLKSLRIRKLGPKRTIHKSEKTLIMEEQNTQHFTPTDEHKDVYQKCREDLLKRQLSNTENFDRAILTLSSSFLGLTLTFIRNVIPVQEAHHVWLLLSAWVCLAIAIVVTLLSFLISQEATKTQMIYAEEYYLHGKNEYLNKKNNFSSLNDWASHISAATFVIAISFLVSFVYLNITNGEKFMSETKNNFYQGERGANIPAMQPISKPPVVPSSSGTSGKNGTASGGQSTDTVSGSK